MNTRVLCVGVNEVVTAWAGNGYYKNAELPRYETDDDGLISPEHGGVRPRAES